MGAVMSFGQDPRWRRALVAGIDPAPDQRVLDVATGTGLVAAELVRHGAGEVVALDQSEDMLGRARARAGAGIRRWPSGSRSSQGEAERLPFADGEFDALTFTYLLRYVDDRAATMRELARVVQARRAHRHGSSSACPRDARAARRVARLHARRAARARAAARRATWYEVGRFLGPSIERLRRASRAGSAGAVARGRDRATCASGA